MTHEQTWTDYMWLGEKNEEAESQRRVWWEWRNTVYRTTWKSNGQFRQSGGCFCKLKKGNRNWMLNKSKWSWRDGRKNWYMSSRYQSRTGEKGVSCWRWLQTGYHKRQKAYWWQRKIRHYRLRPTALPSWSNKAPKGVRCVMRVTRLLCISSKKLFKVGSDRL